ncbi:MAG: family 78 glycoside hydrolase catalytic domain, partial [Clostridia bacterium]|nr:family 78 glycoside hydrolase catalytic domain [Clostridia bacterium]
MIFDNISFIKPNRSMADGNIAPMFRKKISLDKTDGAKLYVCALGYGIFYINGKKATEDLFIAPVSDYEKTLWYTSYDVSHLLKKGENVFSVWCGNGWYNEDFSTPWNYDKAPWRDLPKFILKLEIDGKTVLSSDETWKCKSETAIIYNALRSGEHFDARLYDDNWKDLDFCDRAWENAVIDDNAPKGVFRECTCEPIREIELYETKKKVKIADDTYVFDIGQNISGYIRIKIKGKEGQKLKIRYCELVNDDWTLQQNKMPEYFPNSEFQTDYLILSGKEITWSPKFCYHGFRYIEISGLNEGDDPSVCGVFVHQMIERTTEFECSSELLTKMFAAGIYSSYANMFYTITDCPSREKLGWMNDAQSSLEQLSTNFKIDKLLEKWLFDIYDAMKEDGALPGTIPTAGWGYHWGNGPVSDGSMFEIPHKIYLRTGNKKPLLNSLEYFDRYFEYIKNKSDDDGFVRFGLPDWAKPGFGGDSDHPDVPVEFVNALLIYHFYNVATLAAELAGKDASGYRDSAKKLREKIIKTYIKDYGTCIFEQQTAVAMLIFYDVYKELEPLKKQLMSLIEKNNFHHDCGMVGLRRLYTALNKCGLYEYAYKIITVKGYPSYSDWFERGATSLWEYWDWQQNCDSKNHHMYS